MDARATRFHTLQGHFSNPVDNVLAATRHLESLPIYGNSQAEIEARNAIEMLKTAVVQHAQYSHGLDRLHSTPQASHTRSRHEDLPVVNSGLRRFPQHDMLGMPDTQAQDIVDVARAARQVETTAVAGQVYPAYMPPPPTPQTPGASTSGYRVLHWFCATSE